MKAKVSLALILVFILSLAQAILSYAYVSSSNTNVYCYRISGIKVKCLETGQEEVLNYLGEAYFKIVSNSTLTFIPTSFVNGITSFYEAEV